MVVKNCMTSLMDELLINLFMNTFTPALTAIVEGFVRTSGEDYLRKHPSTDRQEPDSLKQIYRHLLWQQSQKGSSFYKEEKYFFSKINRSSFLRRVAVKVVVKIKTRLLFHFRICRSIFVFRQFLSLSTSAIFQVLV